MEISTEYKDWITEVKAKVRSSQIKAGVAVNTDLIEFYWDLGKMLSEKIKQSNWGDKVLENVSKDLRKEFPDMKGFSVNNLKYTRLFYEYFTLRPQVEDLIGSLLTNSLKNTDNQYDVIRPQSGDEFASQFLGQILWGSFPLGPSQGVSEQNYLVEISGKGQLSVDWSQDLTMPCIKLTSMANLEVMEK